MNYEFDFMFDWVLVQKSKSSETQKLFYSSEKDKLRSDQILH